MFRAFMLINGQPTRQLPDVEHIRHYRLYFSGMYCDSGGVQFTSCRVWNRGLHTYRLNYFSAIDSVGSPSRCIIVWKIQE